MKCLQTLLTAVLFACVGSWSSVAQAASDLEQAVRQQLDRMFYSEQYVLDVQRRASTQPTDKAVPVTAPLPGLGVLSSYSDGDIIDDNGQLLRVSRGKAGYDVFAIFDKSVSNERRQIAEKLIRRILVARIPDNNFTLEVTRGDILRTMPPELKESLRLNAAATPTAQDGWADDQAEEETPENTAPAATPAPAQAPGGLLDKLPGSTITVNVPGFGTVSWTNIVMSVAGVAAILGTLIYMIKKMSGQNSAPPPVVIPPMQQPQESSRRPRFDPVEATDKLRMSQQTRRVRRLREGLLKECELHTEQVADILARWAASSDEDARNARLFLENCDINVVNKISTEMTPADLGIIFSRTIDDFNPMGDDSVRAMERLRSELALHNSGAITKKRENPLEFLKKLSEEDISNVLRTESNETIAKVATQVSPAMLSSLFAEFNEERVLEISQLMPKMMSLVSKDFDDLGKHLQKRIATLGDSLVDERSIVRSMVQLVGSIADPVRQTIITTRMADSNESLYRKVRDRLILPLDLDNLSEGAIKLFPQEMDAQLLGTALSRMQHDFKRMATCLPQAYQTIFLDELTREHTDTERERAWKKVQQSIREFLDGGIVSQQEIQAAHRKCVAIEKNLLERLEQSQQAAAAAAASATTAATTAPPTENTPASTKTEGKAETGKTENKSAA